MAYRVRTVDFFIRWLEQKLLKSWVPVRRAAASCMAAVSRGSGTWRAKRLENTSAQGPLSTRYS